MINRQNWLDVRAYVYYLETICQRDPETVSRIRAHLRHLLEWADHEPLGRAKNITPIFPNYLLTARADGRTARLSPESINRALSGARAFFVHARMEWPARYQAITDRWVNLLQPPALARPYAQITDHQFWSIDDVLKIAAVSVETLREERAKVAVAMLFLSGMRADALASIPIACVDLAAGRIIQDPRQGVRTKGSKAGITYLLDIPELHKVVDTWDQLVRATLSPHALWYATLDREGMRLTETTQAFDGRHTLIRNDVHIICERAGVNYLSPHKLRHGHVVYALRKARNMRELKAISQNVMHSSVTITDQIYGGLAGEDVQETITGLGHQKQESMEAKLDELLQLLKGR